MIEHGPEHEAAPKIVDALGVVGHGVVGVTRVANVELEAAVPAELVRVVEQAVDLVILFLLGWPRGDGSCGRFGRALGFGLGRGRATLLECDAGGLFTRGFCSRGLCS